jgi:hypothetical protein
MKEEDRWGHTNTSEEKNWFSIRRDQRRTKGTRGLRVDVCREEGVEEGYLDWLAR